jgi:hypothetical protein
VVDVTLLDEAVKEVHDRLWLATETSRNLVGQSLFRLEART